MARQEKGAQEIAIRIVYQLRGVAAPLLRRPVGRGSLVKPRESRAPAPSQHLATTGDRDEHPHLPPRRKGPSAAAAAASKEPEGKEEQAPRKLLAATFSGAAPPAPTQFAKAMDRGVAQTLQIKAPPEGRRLEAVSFRKHAAEIEELRQERDAL